MTDPDFKFPQVWRTNIAIDRRLPFGITSTTEFLYNRDINGMYYINANLPAPQSQFVGADNRPRWVGVVRAHGPCQTASIMPLATSSPTRIVLKNQNIGRSWVFAESAVEDVHPRPVAARRL